MKNIIRKNVNEIDNPISYVEYEIMKWENEKVLRSLNNPETLQDAINHLKIVLEKKYKNIIPVDNEQVLSKIIAQAFQNNRKIEDELSIFAQQISPQIAQTKVETWFVVAQFALDAYKPINNIDYPENDLLAA